MKKNLNLWYWIVTGLFAAFMAFTAIPDIMMSPDAVNMITGLGYPDYFIPFIGVAKLLGAIAILIPNFDRVKEWAYAGLFFDLAGATYSAIYKEGFHLSMTLIFIFMAVLFLSYYLWHKKMLHYSL